MNATEKLLNTIKLQFTNKRYWLLKLGEKWMNVFVIPKIFRIDNQTQKFEKYFKKMTVTRKDTTEDKYSVWISIIIK